jgi:hypothetical protein
MQIKNSLKTLLGYLKSHYPRQKFAIGSFLIVALLGFLSVRALATSDHLMAWAPQDTNYYFHLKIQKADPVWQKIKNIKPFEDIEIELKDLVPQKAEELSIYNGENGFVLLIHSSKKPNSQENLETKKLDDNIYLVSLPETAIPEKNEIINLAASHSLGQEPLTSVGYLYINEETNPGSVPPIINPWQDAIKSQPQAWSLHIEDEILTWKSQNAVSNGSIDLRSENIPQNTVIWTHGNNWHKAWQASFLEIPANSDIIQTATDKYSNTLNELNNPETSFQPLFANPFDLFITNNQENTSFSLKIRKNQDNNPIWLHNFREYWLKQVQKGLPLYALITLPDGSRAVEMSTNELLSWEEQNITNSTINWLKGPDNEFIIGYLETNDSLIISNNYGNLVDFLYSEDQDSWLSLKKMADKCGFNINHLNIYMANIHSSANLSEIINMLGPYLISTNQDICHI